MTAGSSTVRSSQKDTPARKRAEIEQSWAIRGMTQPEIRRSWLERHFAEQKGRCAYCTNEIKIGPGKTRLDERATIDHVVARANGGPDIFENTVAACQPCNVAKADLPLETFLKHPVRIERLRKSTLVPDRLSVDSRSPYYNAFALGRGVGVRFRSKERFDVEEYCISEGWVRVPAGKAYSRNGRPIAVKLDGPVEAWFHDAPAKTILQRKRVQKAHAVPAQPADSIDRSISS